MRILLATDGSKCSGVAVDLVAALTWPPGSTIHVVEAIPSGLAVFGGPWPPLPPVDTTPFDDDIRERAEKNIEAAAARLSGRGYSVETATATGRASDVIISLAERTDADLIVVGSRGHGSLESMLLGSVSSEVIDHAHVPVLVARGPSVERVLYAWDGSTCAEEGAHALTDWGVFAASEVHVVSVADAAPPWVADADTVDESAAAAAYLQAAEPSRAQHEELAKDMARRLEKEGLKTTSQRRDGSPAEEIVDVAKSWPADLIIVGTHGRTGLRRLLAGSVARNVLHHAHCSVLIVRDPVAAETAPGIA